jgi:glutamate racemase
MEPAIKPAALHTKTGKVAVLATEGTLRGELFERTREKYARDIEVIEAVGYGWVEIVERGAMNSAEAERRVRRVVEPLMRAGVDTLVLGCTHYPFLMPMIRAIVGAEVEVIDPSAAVARQTARVLAERGLLKNTQNPRQTRGKIEWFTSGEAREFERVRALVWKP